MFLVSLETVDELLQPWQIEALIFIILAILQSALPKLVTLSEILVS